MKRLRGVAFDIGVGIVLVALVSGPVIYSAVFVHAAVKRMLRLSGVM